MYYACMVNIQIRDVPEQVRDVLAASAKSHGQSMQVYLLSVLEEDARRANNVALLRQARRAGPGYVSAPGETASEIAEMRAERDRRNG